MKRIKRHKVKQEVPDASTSRFREQEEHDLAHYIHDRVELMHQVFSVIKHKELKAMAPACVQHITIDDLQELCTEELLGISSKRLCAILDGADPPTDTESSSSEHLETISLDSISSDDEILSQPSTKKKHKHKKHKSKNKHKHKCSKASDQDGAEVEDRSKASRAGLTVLELLELQARARAIRAQLQQDNAHMQTETEKIEPKPKEDSSDEVEIKEEPAEVVEISSEDEKPKIEDLPVKLPSATKQDEIPKNSKTVTKRINDLVVTVPQPKPSRKIKLNRNKTVTLVSSDKTSKDVSSKESTSKTVLTPASSKDSEVKNNTDECKSANNKSKTKKRQKRKGKKLDKEGSDHDEITLQLSDTEKMDLLEDFDRKNYENFTSSSEDSASSSETSSENNTSHEPIIKTKQNHKNEVNIGEKNNANAITIEVHEASDKDDCVLNEMKQSVSTSDKNGEPLIKKNNNGPITESDKDPKHNNAATSPKDTDEDVTASVVTDIVSDTGESTHEGVDQTESTITQQVIQNLSGNLNESMENIDKVSSVEDTNTNSEIVSIDTKEMGKESLEEGEIVVDAEQSKELSEGEITDKDDVQPDSNKPIVVCVSDEEGEKRKKKKKDKKSKKEKKCKKSKSNFREGADQNFFRENANFKKDEPSLVNQEKQQIDTILTIDSDDGDIYEILELSDDSSCYEVEGISVSKEPTAAEIEALSAKIDDIQTIHAGDVIVINEKDSIEDTLQENGNSNKDLENISWRDRYLGSKKVRQVLTTSNILNALRKKNKELKKKLEESKNETEDITGSNKEEISEKDIDIVEGSIEHFNTLEGSSKYVDPVVPEEKNKEDLAEVGVKKVTKEMEKDAKQLLKMYKRLLKYNDMNKKKDPSQKKKKKHKKNKVKDKTADEQ